MPSFKTLLLPGFLLVLSVFLLGTSRPVLAHPMGNFSINHYAHLDAETGKITIRYVLDMAEIPTVSERQTMDTDHNDQISPTELTAYTQAKSVELVKNLNLTVDGTALPLVISNPMGQFRPGAGGLNILRLAMTLKAVLPAGQSQNALHLHYQDTNYPERTGWKEIVVTSGHGISVQASNASPTDTTNELTVYPTGGGIVPPQQTETDVVTQVGVASASLAALPAPPMSATSTTRSTAPQDAFTQSIAKKKLTPQLMFIGLLLAFIFGSFHALSPGHGKTMVAAYLVGSRGTAKHAVLLGIVVTITHTLGVFALGLVTLFLSKYIVPEKLYPWLSAISGAAVCGVGVWLLYSRLRGIPEGHSHDHDHDHEHTHDHDHTHTHDDGHTHDHDHSHDHMHSHDDGHTHDHDHDHTHDHDHSHDGGHSHGFGHHHHHGIPEGPLSAKALVALGISGGIVPCPSALVVLLSAIALHRIAYGLALITAFSFGLATVLVAIGLMVVSAAHWISRFPSSGVILKRLPIASAAAITIIGIVLVYQAIG